MTRLRCKLISTRDDYDRIIHKCSGIGDNIKYEPLEPLVSEIREYHEEKLKRSYLIERIETRIRGRKIK